MTALYAPNTHSIQTEAYARELINNAVSNGATTIHLGSVEYIAPGVVSELQTLAAEHDLQYVDAPESTKHLLETTAT